MIQKKCPICGKPVPPSKGVKPRTYCSTKCATRASHDFARNHGYKHPKSHRKVCPICNSELGQIVRIERRGFCPIATHITHFTHF